jgi:hypothetical protein
MILGGSGIIPLLIYVNNWSDWSCNLCKARRTVSIHIYYQDIEWGLIPINYRLKYNFGNTG